jgi:dipeptidyl aminopeptidase/acylaminoacyl peptidase
MNSLRRSSLKQLLLISCIFALALSGSAAGQQSAKKRPLTHSDYDSWHTIQTPRLSRDGKFLAYALTPEDGDGEVVVRNIGIGTEWRYGIGARQTQTADEEEAGGAGAPPLAPVPPAVFSFDDRFVAFQIRPSKTEMDKAKKEKKKPEDQPKSGIGIMNLSNGEVSRIDRVKSFQMPEETGGFIAYLMEAEPQPASNAGASPASGPDARTPKTKKELGTELVLRNLADQNQRVFPDALEYSLSRDGKTLAFTVSSKKEESEGIYVITPGSTSEPVTLLSGKGKYTKISWDEKQTQFAFLSDRDDTTSAQPKMKLYLWDRRNPSATEIVSVSSPNFRAGLVISERGAINFSLDGDSIFFGVAPPAPPEKDAAETDTSNDDKVSVDLWNWRDDFIQPMQKVRANQERNRSFRAVYHKSSGKFVQLADETMQNLTASGDGRWAVGADDRTYRTLVGVEGSNFSDYYLVDSADGTRKPLLKKQAGAVSWSPNGHYGLYYQDKNWFVVSTPDGETTNLTKNLGVNFYQEDFDSPNAAPAYGVASWTKDDKYVLINDRYDIWQIAADGSEVKNLTNGAGRKDKTVLRYVRLEQPEPGGDRGIDPAKPLLLTAINEWTRDEGYYTGSIGGGPPEKLIMGPKAFRGAVKAKDADVVMLTESTFSEFPDLTITNSRFTNMKKVSNADPQKDGLLWGSAELVRYKNTDGIQLSGILMKPENFDPSKKYPMMVYIYEKLSQNLNTFVNPSPGTSINAAYYVSNGYLVLEPDIVYTIGYPGQSALKCVLSAVQAVVDKGYVNEDAIGIQGHSWGGYQIAYMVTQTNRFKAAAPGAVVANMTSAYSGIRWGTGSPRQFQYEHTQSRIGGTIWEYPMRFIENSPLFQLDRVQTPILTIHNDADTAVPWYQGIEFYLGLRRLGKEVYMFSYNGEPHGLTRRPNQKDYTVRLQQFFDHFLKGAPEPDWMVHGIPFLQKGKEPVTSSN